MIYARAHDQTVADDYFTAMQRVERRLQGNEVVKVQHDWMELVQKLEEPELCFEERVSITTELREILGLQSPK